jgi:dienelactone hydrolase
MDHSEAVVPDLAPRHHGETNEQRAARWEAVIANRVPDIRFLLDHLLAGAASAREVEIDPGRIGIVGYSFGGWTALAAAEVDRRIRSVVALAAAGGSKPRAGMLPVTLSFKSARDVPTLYLVAENDTFLPLAGAYELFERTPGTKQMVILRRADHAHFLDNVEEEHEFGRAMPASGELAEMLKEVRPISELCSGEAANAFARGLTLCHMDATLSGEEAARRFLAGDLEAELASRGVIAIVHKS